MASAIAAGCLVAVTTGGAAQAADCPGRVPSDINGDGFADLAVGARLFFDQPGRDVWGGIEITYGTANGFSDASPSQAFMSPLSPVPIAGIAEALAVGHFNDDCFADLVTAMMGPDGLLGIMVIPGAADGADLPAARLIPSTDIVPGDDGAWVRAFAVGDFNADGFDDLAAGTPNWPYVDEEYGGVAVLYGSVDGLTASTDHWFDQNRPGVPGANELDDIFGHAVAAGDFTGDGYDDLAIGAPGEDIGHPNVGAVTILKGSAEGLTAFGSQSWHQDRSGVPGASEPSDHFGGALEAGDFDRDGHADLAIGIIHESVGSAAFAGAVLMLRGAPDGLTSAGAQSWHQGSPGIPGGNEMNDLFGGALSVGHFNADAFPDLAVAAPAEDIGSAETAGAVTLLLGTPTGLTGVGSMSFTQNSAGIPGAPERDDRFGQVITSVHGPAAAPDGLVIAAPSETIGALFNEGTVVVLPGGPGGPAAVQTWQWRPNLTASAGSNPAWGSSLAP